MTLARQRVVTMVAMLLVVAGGFGVWVQVTTITGHVDQLAGWSHGSVWALAGCAAAALALWSDAKRTALSVAVLTAGYLVLNAYSLPGQMLRDFAG